MTTFSFVDELPGRQNGDKGLSRDNQVILDELKKHPGKWAKVGDKVRSPETFFPLRDHEVEIQTRNNGTMPSTKDATKLVLARDVWASYKPGYKWTPKGK